MEFISEPHGVFFDVSMELGRAIDGLCEPDESETDDSNQRPNKYKQNSPLPKSCNLARTPGSPR